MARTTIAGAKELDRALAQLPNATSKSVLRRALKNAGKPTATLAERTAPLGPTGNLRDSVSVELKLTQSQQRRRAKAGDVEMFIGATAPPGYHAHLIEFGTSKMSARPFLRPAWDSTKQKVLDEIESEIWKSLSKAARTLAKKAQAGTLGKSAQRKLSE